MMPVLGSDMLTATHAANHDAAMLLALLPASAAPILIKHRTSTVHSSHVVCSQAKAVPSAICGAYQPRTDPRYPKPKTLTPT